MTKIIEDELAELKKCCENVVNDSVLVACVRAMIRVEISKSDFKTVAVCLNMPQNYPDHHILVEIKSRNLSRKLLDGLEKVSEAEAKKYVGKPHVLFILKFISQFLDDNPLVSCAEEISKIKQLLGANDKLKLSQKTSSIHLRVNQNEYYFKTCLKIPNNYPKERVTLTAIESNFPRVFKVWFAEQAKEMARRCVEAPLKPKPNQPPFEAKPSLEPAVAFIIKHVQRYPQENCCKCQKRAFPEDPAQAVHNEKAAAHVERVYCSHVYHHDCLILYMKTPPFEGNYIIKLKNDQKEKAKKQLNKIPNISGGKKCLACDLKIYHEKWKVTPQLAEARWAHEQARERELGEVVEFFDDTKI